MLFRLFKVAIQFHLIWAKQFLTFGRIFWPKRSHLVVNFQIIVPKLKLLNSKGLPLISRSRRFSTLFPHRRPLWVLMLLLLPPFARARMGTLAQISWMLSGIVIPRRGVRQGDPLLPALFFFVRDFILWDLPGRLGAIPRESVRIYPILHTLTESCFSRGTCLQDLVNSIFSLLSSTGLEISCEKSFTFSWLWNKRLKKSFYDTSA